MMCINEFLDVLKFILTCDLCANLNSGMSKGGRFAQCLHRDFVPLLLKLKHEA